MRKQLVRASVLAFAAVASAVHADQKKLAVIDFQVQQGLQIDAQPFTNTVQNAATKAAPHLFLMTKQNIEDLLSAQNKKLEDCEGGECVSVGRFIGADYVASGRVAKVGRTFTLSMQLFEVGSGRQLAGENIRGKTEDELLEELEAAAARLVKPLAQAARREGDVAGNVPKAGASTPEISAADAEKVASPGEEKVEPKSGLAFVHVPSGRFHFGCELRDTKCSSDEKPGRTERVFPMWLGKTQVTVEAYGRCVQAGACGEPSTSPYCNWKTDRTNHPINCLTFHQAMTFCGWIGGRLPTPVEREYAAKSGESRVYPWGDQEPGARACWNGTGNDLGAGKRKSTCRVGSFDKGATKWGLHDMAGNVSEWTYSNDDAGKKEVRGGSWSLRNPEDLRASYRDWLSPSVKYSSVGVRCAL